MNTAPKLDPKTNFNATKKNYDALGLRTRSTDASGTFEYAYDPSGRLTSRTTPDALYPLSVKAQVNGQTVGTLAGHRPGDATYGYDAAGRPSDQETTGTHGAAIGKITYTYDGDGCG
ncbi:MAG: RHS repeat domain-containing protein, partial [Acidimicrobiia bacterium]